MHCWFLISFSRKKRKKKKFQNKTKKGDHPQLFQSEFERRGTIQSFLPRGYSTSRDADGGVQHAGKYRFVFSSVFFLSVILFPKSIITSVFTNFYRAPTTVQFSPEHVVFLLANSKFRNFAFLNYPLVSFRVFPMWRFKPVLPCSFCLKIVLKSRTMECSVEKFFLPPNLTNHLWQHAAMVSWAGAQTRLQPAGGGDTQGFDSSSVAFFSFFTAKTNLSTKKKKNLRPKGVDLSHKLITRIANSAPNIVGLKDSGGNVQKLAMVRELCPDLQCVAGSFGFLLPAMVVLPVTNEFVELG